MVTFSFDHLYLGGSLQTDSILIKTVLFYLFKRRVIFLRGCPNQNNSKQTTNPIKNKILNYLI
jgi:hypothetical protein